MSDKLRAAAEAALEFAEFCWRDVPMNEFAFGECERAIDKLRAALAEPQAKQSTSAWAKKAMELATDFAIESLRVGSYERRDALLNHGVYQFDTAALRDKREAARALLRQHIYIGPPRREWQSLTDEEIDACWKAANALRLLPSFTEQIQAKLKEKNYG